MKKKRQSNPGGAKQSQSESPPGLEWIRSESASSESTWRNFGQRAAAEEIPAGDETDDSSSSSSCSISFDEAEVAIDWEDGYYYTGGNLSTDCHPIDWSLNPEATSTIDSTGQVTFSEEGEILTITASHNPSATMKATVAKVEVTKASIREGEFTVQLAPAESTGKFELYFKKDKTEALLKSIEKQAGGEVTINLDDVLAKLSGEDQKKFDSVFAKWTIGKTTIKSKDKDLDVKVQVLANWKITYYFTPDWDGQWAGPTVPIGVYDPDDYPGSIHSETRAVNLLNAMTDAEEGLGRSGDVVLKLHEESEVAGVPRYMNKYYVANPDPEQDEGKCVHRLSTKAAAVRNANALLKCADEVYVGKRKEPRVRTIEDVGGLHGENKHIDIYIGFGGQSVQKEANGLGDKAKHTLLKLLK